MAKVCGYCGEKIRILTTHVKLKDGMICKNCLEKAGIDHFPLSQEYSVETVKPILTKRMGLYKLFDPIEVGSADQLKIDTKNQLFQLCGNMYEYSDFVRYHQDTIHKTETITHEVEGEGRAVGALIGSSVLASPRVTKKGKIKTSLIGRTAGAAIGGAIGSSLSKREVETTIVVDYMEFDIILDSSIANEETLEFNLSKSKKNKQARRCADLLEQIAHFNEMKQHKAPSKDSTKEDYASNGADDTESIRAYYELYKNGAITIDEYQRKKNQIMGLPEPLVGITKPNDSLNTDPIRVPQMSNVLQQGQKASIGLHKFSRERIMIDIGWKADGFEPKLTAVVNSTDSAGCPVQSHEGIQFHATGLRGQAHFCIDFSKMHPSIQRISFMLQSQSTFQSKADFSTIDSMWIQVLHEDHSEIFSFTVSESRTYPRSWVLGEIYLNRDK